MLFVHWQFIGSISNGACLTLSSQSLLWIFSSSSPLYLFPESSWWNLYLYPQKHNLSYSAATLAQIVIFYFFFAFMVVSKGIWSLLEKSLSKSGESWTVSMIGLKLWWTSFDTDLNKPPQVWHFYFELNIRAPNVEGKDLWNIICFFFLSCHNLFAIFLTLVEY